MCLNLQLLILLTNKVFKPGQIINGRTQRDDGWTLFCDFHILVLVCVLYLQVLTRANLYFSSNMTSCPSLRSMQNVDINQLMGEWNLVLLFMDEGFEEYEDDSNCVHANFKKANNTSFKQIWYMNTLQFGYGAVVELRTRTLPSGDWKVINPLGGDLDVKVIHAYPKSHMILTFCAMQNDLFVHLWTIVVTRKAKISDIDYLQLSKELLAKGFNVNNIKMITWNKC